MGPLGVYLRGLCMGAADAVPGVSGGTIALITGIYDRLVAALTAIDPDRIRDVVRAVGSGDWQGAGEALVRMDVPFLATLGAGVVTAVVLASGAVETAVTHAPVPTFGFFAGLIAASAVVLYDQLQLDTPGRKLAAVTGFVVAFVVSGVTTGGLGSGLPMTFVAGAIAVTAMVLPGISGSLLLLIMGQYVSLVTSLNAFVASVLGLLDGTASDQLFSAGLVVATFVAGALVGLFTAAHLIRLALDRRREATLAFLVSLIVGALRAPVERIDAAVTAWTPSVVVAAAVPLVVGGLVVLVFDRYADVTY